MHGRPSPKHKRTPCLLLLLLLLAAATGTRWRPRQQNNEGALAGSGGCSAYLVVGAFWGLNNQRYSILRGAYAAHQLGCCLVAPPLYVDYGQRDLNWTLRPFDYFFDWGAFAAGAAALGFRAVRALPPALVPNCTAQLQYDKLVVEDVSLGLLRNWQARTGVACLAALNTIMGLKGAGEKHASEGGLAQSYRLLQPYLHLLRPSRYFQSLLDAAVARLRASYGASGFVAVQGRIEKDWALSCRDYFRAEMKAEMVQCYVDDPTLTRVLQSNFSVPAQTHVFVMSGMPKVRFAAMCRAFSCVTKDDLLDASDPAIRDLLNHTTTAAYLDFLIASRASAVYGNVISSFGRALVGQAGLSGVPAHYYNPYCDPDQNVTRCSGVDPATIGMVLEPCNPSILSECHALVRN
eukprot:scaffold27.g5992.t1